MKKTIMITILTLLFLNQTLACLNGASLELKDGTFVFEDEEGNVPYGHRFRSDEDFKDGVKQLDRLYKKTKDLDYLSDKGLLLILLKQYNEAVDLYLEIEKLEPNRYSTASNIGTAYELLGQNEKALHWIKKSVEIDPQSHENSEWIHVKILEAKIKGEELYTTNFLLNTEFGVEERPTSKLSKSELLKLSNALYYQLNERVSFVKPKEKIVAQLLFDLGNIAVLRENYDDALGDYKQAKKYGFRGQLIEKRMKEAEKGMKEAEKMRNEELAEILAEQAKNDSEPQTAQPEKSYQHYGIWAIGAALATFIMMLIYRKRQK